MSGNPIAMTAGLVTLRELQAHPEIYDKLEATTKTLADAYREVFGNRVCVNQVGSLMSVFFTGQKVTDFASAKTSDTDAYAKYFCFMLSHGVNLAPSQFEAMFLSAAHTEEDIKKTCDLIKEYGGQYGR